MMARIHYVLGDATRPQGPAGPKIIAHVCNDIGGWGAGFVLALSRWDDTPERVYRQMAGQDALVLGEVHYANFGPHEDDVYVANMVAQRGFKTVHNKIPLDYKALRECLDAVGDYAADIEATVHMPRIGCGLGGGEWGVVEEAILALLIDIYDVDVYVYDLPTPEAVEAHHLMDEKDKEFQEAVHELAEKCSACGQPLPQTAA